MNLQSYNDLRVWQQRMDLDETLYKMTRTFPKQEQFGFVSQMQRAVVSVPSSIVEGYTRSYEKEYLQFLATSPGSLCELETRVEIAYRLPCIADEIYKGVSKAIVTLSKQLLSLPRSLAKQFNTQAPIP